MISWFYFVHNVLPYSHFLIFLVSLVAAEEGAIFLAIISGNGLIRFWEVLVFGLLGLLLQDVLWFYFARGSIFRWIRIKLRKSGIYKRASAFVRKVRHKNSIVYLTYSKFFKGARLISVTQVARESKGLLEFLAKDFIALLIWAVIMLPLGWFAGRGFAMALHVFRNIDGIIVTALLILLVFYLLEGVVRRFIERVLNS